MKKIALSLLAATVFAAPFTVAEAQSMHQPQHRPPHYSEPMRKPPVMFWKRGDRLKASVGRSVIRARDYRRYGLPAPRRDQVWVRVGGQLLLISERSGLVLQVRSLR